MSMLHLEYQVPGDDFTRAGEASGDVKHKLKKLGYEPDAIRRVAIAMYEGEINLVIHGGGGEAIVDVDPDRVDIALIDQGPGIPDVEQAMQAGWSTAPDNVRALGFGALTQGEYDMLRSCVFLRAHAAYVSYYSLDMPLNGGVETLAQRLIAAGRMTEAQLESARARINSSRIS